VRCHSTSRRAAHIIRCVGARAAHHGIQMRSISCVPVRAHRRLCQAVSHTRGRKSDKSVGRARAIWIINSALAKPRKTSKLVSASRLRAINERARLTSRVRAKLSSRTLSNYVSPVELRFMKSRTNSKFESKGNVSSYYFTLKRNVLVPFNYSAICQCCTEKNIWLKMDESENSDYQSEFCYYN